MNGLKLSSLFVALAATALMWVVAPALGDDYEACFSGSPYGDGSDGDYHITGNTTFVRDVYLRNLTVYPGVRLNTAGHTVRVCGTLLNQGTITDCDSGGDGGSGGSGGAGGWGYLPHHNPQAGNPGESGENAQSQPRSVAGAGGHGGGGGGGGAAWNYRVFCLGNDSPGGDGGGGGDGGHGGGYVTVYAYHLVNDGAIHANGLAGAAGTDGQPGVYHSYYCGVPAKWNDHATGGGGARAGGNGGHAGGGGLYYGDTSSGFGQVQAAGGAGGAGGAAGVCPCAQLAYAYRTGQVYEEGASGGSPGGGDGGESDIGDDCGTGHPDYDPLFEYGFGLEYETNEVK